MSGDNNPTTVRSTASLNKARSVVTGRLVQGQVPLILPWDVVRLTRLRWAVTGTGEVV